MQNEEKVRIDEMADFTLGGWFETTSIILLFSIAYILYQIYISLIVNREILRRIVSNTDRRKSDRRKITMSVSKEKRIADRRDAEVARLHSLYHEGDVNIAPSYADRDLNKNQIEKR